MFEKIELYLNANAEYAWVVILFFAFLESFILSGVIISSAILFSICIFIYNTELLPLFYIVPVAVLGAHLGDMTGFLFGKTIGPQLLSTKVMVKREKLISRAQKFLDKTGSYTVILGRFIPAVRPIVPFLLGVSDLKLVRFYIADLIACIFWGIALGFLVTGVGSLFG
ncbi:MAG: DedA family protein [Gammaproteobacteria bacterium TMED242]|nr:MAG: DedA family protein [Gammaproteobacteria bacterium TMED242]|tara:strand:- start:1095 stop:1598 length:504 start_codon:yes stop_codon:yes gene_type:complete